MAANTAIVTAFAALAPAGGIDGREHGHSHDVRSPGRPPDM
jgi:hypothetical protein